MDAARAVSLLKSADASERLRGARALRTAATSAHRTDIDTAFARETDSWVRSALGRARDRLDGVAVPAAADTEELSEVSREVRAQATAEATTMLLHELRPLVGLLRLRAERELADYETSNTGRSIERLVSFLAAVKLLRESAGAPTWAEFNLSDLVARTVESELEEEDRSTVMAVGTDPTHVVGDESLLQLALAQAVRNAVEAIEDRRGADLGGLAEEPNTGSATGSVEVADPGVGLTTSVSGIAPSSPSIVINYGITDRDYWVVVLDDGIGLPAGADQVFEMWATGKSKSKHFGIGLPLARRAMATLDGTVELQPREQGGAACEIRWPQPTGFA